MKRFSWIFLLTAALLSGCSKPRDTDGGNQTGALMDGPSKTANAVEFEQAISAGKPVLVDFFATW